MRVYRLEFELSKKQHFVRAIAMFSYGHNNVLVQAETHKMQTSETLKAFLSLSHMVVNFSRSLGSVFQQPSIM